MDCEVNGICNINVFPFKVDTILRYVYFCVLLTDGRNEDRTAEVWEWINNFIW